MIKNENFVVFYYINMSKFTWYGRNLDRTVENLDYFSVICLFYFLSVCLSVCLTLLSGSQSAVSLLTDVKRYRSFQLCLKTNLTRDLWWTEILSWLFWMVRWNGHSHFTCCVYFLTLMSMTEILALWKELPWNIICPGKYLTFFD